MTRQISRRAFLGGSAAAISVPLTPAAVAWFLKWFPARRFYSIPPKQSRLVYRVIINGISVTVREEWSTEVLAKVVVDTINQSESIVATAKVVDAPEGSIEVLVSYQMEPVIIDTVVEI